MRILVDIGHPAHVHLFRNLIKRVQAEGGAALATTREKEVTVQLCQAYGIPQLVISRKRWGVVGSGREYLERTWKLWRAARQFRPDVLMGTSVSIGPVGRLIGKPSIVFQEDDASHVPGFARLAYPLSSYIATPACLAHEDYGRKHLTYQGYHELAYLHPDHFTPDPAVRQLLGVGPQERFFILRFVSMQAHHDTAVRGIDFETATSLVKQLLPHGRLFISSEAEPHDSFKPYIFSLPPEKLLDALAFADMVIGDSHTVAAEAAVLGVPNIRFNNLIGKCSYLAELEHRYGLTIGIPSDQRERLFQTVAAWLENYEQTSQELYYRRQKLLAECVNVADWQWETVLNLLI
jgi:uncharacterized protein